MQIFILQTVGGFWANGSVGGGVLGVIGTAKEWAASGHDVHFVTNEGDLGRDQYSGEYTVHRVPSLGLALRPSPLYFLLEALLNPIPQRKPIDQLIRAECHGHGVFLAISPYPSDVLTALRLSRSLRRPGAVYFHHRAPPPWWHPFRRGDVLRTTVSWALTTASLALCKVGGLIPIFDQPEELQRAGWRFPEVIADAHFLPPDDVGAVRPDVPAYAACLISRVAPNKGLPDLVRAWSHVRERVPDARLAVAGEWYSEGFRRRILRLTARLGLEDAVSFLGYLHPEAKRRLLDTSRLFVLPSYEEGWSISVMEAAYHGLTPVVYDLPAYGYLGTDAIRVRAGDVRGLGDAIVRVLREPDGRARAAPRLRALLERYNAKSLADDQARCFERLVRRGASPRDPRGSPGGPPA